MNRDRRVVLSLALAAALAVVAATVSWLIVDDAAAGGWFAYDSDGNLISMSESDDDSLRVAAVWLVAIATWFGICSRLFRTRPD